MVRIFLALALTALAGAIRSGPAAPPTECWVRVEPDQPCTDAKPDCSNNCYDGISCGSTITPFQNEVRFTLADIGKGGVDKVEFDDTPIDCYTIQNCAQSLDLCEPDHTRFACAVTGDPVRQKMANQRAAAGAHICIRVVAATSQPENRR